VNKTDEALKLALEALEKLTDTEQTYEALDLGDKAIIAIKQALAAPVQPVQEPVAVVGEDKHGPFVDWLGTRSSFYDRNPVGTKFYTTPPAALVPLTPEQRKNLWVSATIELPSQENCYYRGLVDAEAYHGITEKGQPWAPISKIKRGKS
jgi:hypothetical protein